MDPKANLEEQRRFAAELLNDDYDQENPPDFMSSALRLAELVQALDEWRRGGGFDPYTPQDEASMKCPSCGEFKLCLWDADPYQSEIHNDHTQVWLCAECRHEHAQDI